MKKLSSRPISSKLSSSPRISATRCSVPVRGPAETSSWQRVRRIRHGERRAIDLAVRRQRQRIQPNKCSWKHVLRQEVAQEVTQTGVGESSVPIQDHVGYQPLVPGSVLAGNNQARTDVLVPVQHARDFVRFDPVAADLDLVVDPPQKSELAVRQQAGQVAGLVQPAAGSAPNGLGMNFSAVRSGRS